MSGRGGRLPPELEGAVAQALAAAGLPLRARGEVEAELRAHFEDGMAAGHPPEDLLRRFGDPDVTGRRFAQARERSAGRESEHAPWRVKGREVATEVARTARALLRSPGFSAVVVATLALGVGANTAVFTTLDAVLLAPLPYPSPDDLVRVYERSSEDPDREPNYLRGRGVVEYAAWGEVFASFGVAYTYREMGADLTDGERPQRVVVSLVDGGFFETLRVPPLRGRTFRPEESLPPSDGVNAQPAPLAVLSHSLWTRSFGADPDILGKDLRVDGAAVRVVGVMPPGFASPFGGRPDLWMPQNLTAGGYNSWGNHYLSAVARLRPGVSVEAAQARIASLTAGLDRREPDAVGWEVGIVPLRADVVGNDRRSMLWILAAAVALVLLSACVNVGNLLFARGLGRSRDLAVRSALGSGRSRLLVHLVAESALLALAGGATGLVVGWWGVGALLALAPDALPSLVTPTLDGRVFLVGLGVTTLSLALFGLLPALRFSTANPAHAMRGGSRGGTETRGVRRLRSGLVAAQVAVAVVLMVGAVLLTRSFAALGSVPLGIDPEGVLTFEVHLPDARYPDGARRQAFHQAFQARVADLPGVEAVGAVSWLPVSGRYHQWGVAWSADQEAEAPGAWQGTDVRVITGDYFGTLGIDLVRGRGPEAVDPQGPPVAWIDRTLAREVLGDVNPVGQLISVAGERRRVVGVVEAVAHGPRGATAPTTYILHAQFADDRNWALIQTVRARGDLSALQDALRETLASLDPELVLFRPRSLTAVLAASRTQDRFATTLMATFALLAVVLSAVGTYGVLATGVARQRREIGIRMALGADAGRVRRTVVGAAVAMTSVGAAAGVTAAWIAGRWFRSLLFGVEPADPWSFLAAVTVLLGCAVLAAWLPALRATRVDPARTLTAE